MSSWEDEARIAFGDDADRMIERIRRDAAETRARVRLAGALGAETVSLNLNAPDKIEGHFTPEGFAAVRRLFPLATINGEIAPFFRTPEKEYQCDDRR